MMTVYYTCSFVPLELIAACGCMPQRLTPAFESSRLSQTEGMCSFTQSWLEVLLNKAGKENFAAVFCTSCDQMRRAYDLYGQHSNQHAFLLNVPSTNTQHSLDYYRQELERLQQFLCSFSGKPFDKSQLKTMMSESGEKKLSSNNKRPLKIAITGKAAPASIQNALNEILDASNAGILLDVNNDKLAHHFLEFSRIPMQKDPLTELANSYFRLPAIWKRPNDIFYQRLTDEIRKNDIDGIILLRYIFCDLWHSTGYELKKRLAIPILEIDLDGNAELSASAVSRVQAFSEMLAL